MESLIGAIVGGILAILGSIIAHALAQRDTSKHEKNSKVAQQQAMQVGLRTEINQNLVLIKDIREKVLFPYFSFDPSPQKKVGAAKDFLSYTFPGFLREMYQSQLTAMPSVLSELEVAKIMATYRDFYDIEVFRTELYDAQAFDESHKVVSSNPSGTSYTYYTQRFQDISPQVITKIYNITTQIMKRGNPLE